MKLSKLAAALSTGLGAAMICTSGVASANPAQEHDAAMICRMMDRDSTDTGIEAIVLTMLSHGIDVKVTAETFAIATVRYCPEHADDVRHGLEYLKAKYSPKPTQHPAMVPGCTDESNPSCLLPSGVIM